VLPRPIRQPRREFPSAIDRPASRYDRSPAGRTPAGRSALSPRLLVISHATAAETLRVKAYLAVQRNVVRDHLDVAALAEHLGLDRAVEVLSDIDAFYADRSGEPASVLTSLVVALADPAPRDPDVIPELPRYKGLAARWQRWDDVVDVCRELALRLGGAA
jgi:hypothetical protein